jgi:hypothetical protein
VFSLHGTDNDGTFTYEDLVAALQRLPPDEPVDPEHLARLATEIKREALLSVGLEPKLTWSINLRCPWLARFVVGHPWALRIAMKFGTKHDE